MRNTDLHTHTYYSDGQLSPKQLVRLSKKRGIKNLALTDHNTIKGVQEAIKEGKKIGVNVIPAVEIQYKGGEILAYFINLKNKPLNNALKKIRKETESSVKKFCQDLKKIGYKISFKEIWNKYPNARGNINGFYPLYILFKKGYAKSTWLLGQQLEEKNLPKRKRKKLTAIQVIKLIKKAGGVPVMAHPWFGDTKNNFKKLKSYAKAGLRGIEINNGDRTPLRDKKTRERIKRVAKRYKLIITEGSDYHGPELVKHMPGNHELGKNNCDEKVVEQLRKLSNN